MVCRPLCCNSLLKHVQNADVAFRSKKCFQSNNFFLYYSFEDGWGESVATWWNRENHWFNIHGTWGRMVWHLAAILDKAIWLKAFCRTDRIISRRTETDFSDFWEIHITATCNGTATRWFRHKRALFIHSLSTHNQPIHSAPRIDVAFFIPVWNELSLFGSVVGY